MLAAQGKLEEALKAYRDGLAIVERGAAADRSNTQWQNSLSLSYEKVGTVLSSSLFAGKARIAEMKTK